MRPKFTLRWRKQKTEESASVMKFLIKSRRSSRGLMRRLCARNANFRCMNEWPWRHFYWRFEGEPPPPPPSHRVLARVSSLPQSICSESLNFCHIFFVTRHKLCFFAFCRFHALSHPVSHRCHVLREKGGKIGIRNELPRENVRCQFWTWSEDTGRNLLFAWS